MVLAGAGRRVLCRRRPARPGCRKSPELAREREQDATLRRFTRAAELLHGMGKPTVAAVNGPCVGAGLALACAADIRVAAGSALFATGFLGAGVSGDFGGTWSLASILGQGSARDLYLTGRQIGRGPGIGPRPGRAPCTRPKALLDEAGDSPSELAQRSPTAIRAIKANFAALPCSFSDLLDVETARHVDCTNSDGGGGRDECVRRRVASMKDVPARRRRVHVPRVAPLARRPVVLVRLLRSVRVRRGCLGKVRTVCEVPNQPSGFGIRAGRLDAHRLDARPARCCVTRRACSTCTRTCPPTSRSRSTTCWSTGRQGVCRQLRLRCTRRGADQPDGPVGRCAGWFGNHRARGRDLSQRHGDDAGRQAPAGRRDVCLPYQRIRDRADGSLGGAGRGQRWGPRMARPIPSS